jgi:hypothetical protein
MRTAAKICLVLGLMCCFVYFGPRAKPLSTVPAVRAGELTVMFGLPALYLTAAGILFWKSNRKRHDESIQR